MTTSALLAVLLALPAAAADPAASPAASTAAVAVSTLTVSAIYTGDRVRDPFSTSSSGGVRRSSEKQGDENAPPDIHALTLRGIMKDAANDYALFTAESGESFMLRGGRLHSGAGKPVPGITGRIRLKQKTVELITADKDVQVYRLGEDEEKDKDKERRP
jgi:hypothetical protein